MSEPASLRCLLAEPAGHSSDPIFHAPGAKLWRYASELCTLSVAYPLCGSALNVISSRIICLTLAHFCLFWTVDRGIT